MLACGFGPYGNRLPDYDISAGLIPFLVLVLEIERTRFETVLYSFENNIMNGLVLKNFDYPDCYNVGILILLQMLYEIYVVKSRIAKNSIDDERPERQNRLKEELNAALGCPKGSTDLRHILNL